MKHAALIQSHGIDTSSVDGCLFANDVYLDPARVLHSHWVDITEWSRREVLMWLGY